MFYAIACIPLLKDKAASEIQKNKLLSYIRNIITYVREHKKDHNSYCPLVPSNKT